MLTPKFSLTLILFTTLILTTAHASVDVNRRHGTLNRLIKKRSPFVERADGPVDPLGPVVGAGNDPAAPSTGTTSIPSTTLAETSIQETEGALTTTTSSTSSLSSSSVSASTTSSDTALLTTTSSSTSSSSSSSTSRKTSSTPTPTTKPTTSANPVPSTRTQKVSSVVITSTAAVSSSTATAIPSSGAGKHTTITILIVIAASIGGVAVLWTIIRKWKFRPSSQFEDRMQPIDWQPTVEEGAANHRRVGSTTSSFLSGGHDLGENMAGRGIGAGYGATSDQGHGATLAGIPDHDFTAGPATLAPVGGYADLARGSSPQPQMHEVLTRGPSMSRAHHVVSAHHQGYSQDAYDYNGGTSY